MNRLTTLVVLIVLCASAVMAQASHSAKIGFTPGVPTGSQVAATSWNMYRALADVGPYTKVSTCAASPCTDSTVSGGTTYFFYLTGVAGTLESVPSAHISATIPPDGPPPPPTNLNIISVAMNTFGNTVQIVAQWTAPASETITWSIIDATGKNRASGTSRSSLGTYSLDKTFSGILWTPAQVKVCDSANNCDTQNL